MTLLLLAEMVHKKVNGDLLYQPIARVHRCH